MKPYYIIQIGKGYVKDPFTFSSNAKLVCCNGKVCPDITISDCLQDAGRFDDLEMCKKVANHYGGKVLKLAFSLEEVK